MGIYAMPVRVIAIPHSDSLDEVPKLLEKEVLQEPEIPHIVYVLRGDVEDIGKLQQAGFFVERFAG